MMLAASQGFTLALSMIIPIGSQNSMLLTQGINKNHHLMTAALFMLYDAILISIGVLGGSFILSSNDTLFTLLTWGGIVFLLAYGAMSFKSAVVSMADNSAALINQKSLKVVVITSLIVTFLNPHAYIDTVMVIGSVGGQYSGDAKFYFLMGAISGSIVWFSSLALGAAKLSVVLAKPKVKRVIDTLIGLVMWFIAWSLLMSWLAR
ncbi:amino acid transporter [Colwellia sp. 39_35_sub15_T18]|nr:amino acid transporter [Colwellia sp. 39_35_sub15_T18]